MSRVRDALHENHNEIQKRQMMGHVETINREVNKGNLETKSQFQKINSEIRCLKNRITKGISGGRNVDLPMAQEHDSSFRPSTVSAEGLNCNNVNDSSSAQSSCRSEACSICMHPGVVWTWFECICTAKHS